MKPDKYRVSPDRLRWECDPKIFDFECTKDLAPLREFIGQERATRAVEFGLNMVNSGYNIYVAGLTGSGKTSMVKAYIEKIIKEKQARGETFALQDWCYLYNFKEPDSPQIVNLPRGKGKAFGNDVAGWLLKIRQGLGQAFTNEEYKSERQRAVEEAQVEQQKLFEELSNEARRQGFILRMTSAGPVLVPMKEDAPMQEKEYLALDDEAKKALDLKQAELRSKLKQSFEIAAKVQNATIERLQKSDKDIAEYTVADLFSSLFERYASWPKVNQYLTDLKNYVMDNLEIFKASEEPVNPVLGVPMSQVAGGRDPFLPFQVNVFVDNSEAETSAGNCGEQSQFRQYFRQD